MKRRCIISYSHFCQILRKSFLPVIVGLGLFSGTCKAVDYSGTTTIPTSLYYLPTTALADGDTATGFVLFSDGFEVSGPVSAGVTLNVPLPIDGRIRLNNGSLLNLNGDLNFGSNVSLVIGASGGDGASIDGRSKSIILGNDFGFPDDRRLAVGTGNLTIDGQGYTFSLSSLSTFYIASGRRLTLRNMVINGLSGGAQIVGPGSLQLQNVIINLPASTTWTFSGSGIGGSANLYIADDVTIRGNGTFEFGGDGNLTVNSKSMFTIDQGSTFYYNPQDTLRTHMVFTDQFSSLFLNGSTFKAQVNGVQLTTGTLFMDNHVTLDNGTNSDVTKSIEFGNGAADLTVRVLSGAYVLVNGYVYHNPA